MANKVRLADGGGFLGGIGRRAQARARARLRELRGNTTLVVQTGLAAGAAWYVAHNILNHPAPFFAPISAVIALGISLGHRTRRIIELVVGVAVGIAVGDALILVIGSGAWQVAAVVMLALGLAMLIGSGPLITQAASSAVLVATLTPPQGGLVFTRFIDALVGGGIAFGVHALLLPLNPLRHVRRTAHGVLESLADSLGVVAAALADRDAEAAGDVLQRLRASEPMLVAFRDSLHFGREATFIAPIRWRARGQLAGYADAAPHIDHAVRNGRVLARRGNAALVAGEPVPEQLPGAVLTLQLAARNLLDDLERSVEPEATRRACQDAVARAAAAYATSRQAPDLTGGLSIGVVVAQVRSIAFDLLRATGLDPEEADRTVRRAAHLSTAPHNGWSAAGGGQVPGLV